MNEPTALSAAAIAELRAGRKLSAVRIVRGDTGLDLKESLDLVERYIVANPPLQQISALREEDLRGRGVRVLLVAVALMLLAAYLAFGR